MLICCYNSSCSSGKAFQDFANRLRGGAWSQQTLSLWTWLCAPGEHSCWNSQRYSTKPFFIERSSSAAGLSRSRPPPEHLFTWLARQVPVSYLNISYNEVSFILKLVSRCIILFRLRAVLTFSLTHLIYGYRLFSQHWVVTGISNNSLNSRSVWAIQGFTCNPVTVHIHIQVLLFTDVYFWLLLL